MFNSLQAQFLFLVFFRKSVSVIDIMEKTDERIFMNFSEKAGHETRNNVEHFRDVAVNPLNPGSIFIFSGSVFLVILWKNGWTDFHEIFMICQARHKKSLSGLTRLFHGLPSRRGSVFVNNITTKWMNRFSWNFQNRSVMTWGTTWNILIMMRLTPWIQGSFLYFLGLYLLPILRNNRWMDIHEFFRMWRTWEGMG